MIYSIFPELDATMYEYFPTINTGIDQVLELVKYTSHSISYNNNIFASNYNSRILMQFNLADISSSIASGEISGDCQFFLNLRSCEVTDTAISQSIYAYAASGSWKNGQGNFNDSPSITEGVSWQYKSSYALGDAWPTGSYAANTTGSWIATSGGGNWYTSSLLVASQSINYTAPDFRIDVTNIVKQWMSSSIVNNGFIIKRSDFDETSSEILGSVKFFSKDTHTIYVPRLDVAWNDTSLVTASVSQISDENFVIYMKNLANQYYELDKVKLRLGVRAQYPVTTYATASNYISLNRLPTSSYYEVRDAYSNDIIIPFDTTYTKISCDSSGNYFNIHMNAMFPDRYYKFIIKTVETGITKYHDNSFNFKIAKAN